MKTKGKTRTKRMVSTLLPLIMTITLMMALALPATAATSGTCGENLTWTLDDDGTLTISGTGAMYDYALSELDEEWFSTAPWYVLRGSIYSIIIADGVTSIGDWAFYECSSVVNAAISASVTKIGGHAFEKCHHLSEITIPAGVTTIEEYTFGSCNRLTSVTLPDGVTTIKDRAFKNCESLPSINLPDSLTKIECAFNVCLALTNITIPAGVTTIEDNAFAYCFRLERITVDENNAYYASDDCGVLFNKDKTRLIHYPAGNARTHYTVPGSVTTIDANAFFNCYNLTSITIPESVTTIGQSAFSSCDDLTDVYYTGSEAQWSKIIIEKWNDPLLNATKHFNHKESAVSELTKNEKTFFGSEVSGWAKDEVEEAYGRALVPAALVGKDLTQKVDRAEFAAIAVALYENLSGNKAEKANNPFVDIAGNACEDKIIEAYNLDITIGVSATTFEPNTNITREQMATMLARAYKKAEFPDWKIGRDAEYPLNFMGAQKFADDAEISNYAKESVYFMVRWDIIKGIGDNKFAPKNTATLGDSYGYATREQAVIIALRTAKHL